MKKTAIIILSCIIPAACSHNEGFRESSVAAVEFTGESLSTKTVFSQDGNTISAVWSESDTVGIFCTNTSRGNYPYAALIPDSATPSSARFAAADPDRIFTYDGTSCTYYAYCPYSDVIGNNPAELSLSVPAVQVQPSEDAVEALSNSSMLAASPVSVSGDGAKVNFLFTPVMPIVQLKLKMDDATTIPVPVRKVKLIAADTPLCADGKLDISGEKPSFAADKNPGKEIVLQTPVLTLSSASPKNATFVTLPGTHQSFKAEITAIDNSVCTVDIPGATFRPGCNYVRDLTLSLGDFIVADPFDVKASVLQCKAGENLEFTISGAASAIDFFSGEEFHDYAYRTKSRKVASPEPTSFYHALSAGNSPKGLSVKVSTDYNGNPTEADILKATWTDITEHFTLCTEIIGDTNPITTNINTYNQYFVYSGEYDIAPYFKGADKMYFAFFWHMDKYDETADNTRTVSYLTRLKIGTQYYMTQENFSLVTGANYGSITNLPGWMTPKVANGVPPDAAFRFFSDFRPTGERDAYGVITTALIPSTTDYGPDKPFIVQAEGADTPAEYSYKFETPGTYEVVFVASCPSLSGEVKEEIRKFTVTVTE